MKDLDSVLLQDVQIRRGLVQCVNDGRYLNHSDSIIPATVT
jgi:hypothetical protein